MKNKEARSIFSSLENFSSPPPPELWDKIEAELDKPKKKKRPLIWWWVAAGLVAGLSLPTVWYVNSNQGNIQELNIENNANGVVLQNDSKDNVKENVKDVGSDNGNKNGTTIVKSSFDKKSNNGNEIKNDNLNTEKNHISLTNSNSVVNKTISNDLSKTKNSGKLTNSQEDKSSQFIAVSNDKSKTETIVVGKNATVNSYNSALIIVKNNSAQNNNSNKATKAIANSQKSTSSEPLQNNKSKESINHQSESINQNIEVSGLKSNNAIAENTTTKDSLSKIKKEVAQLENALVELDKDKKKKKTNSEVIDKWSLQVFAGVMSSENYNNEKVLGNTVASKQSNGYGIKTNYKLNKKNRIFYIYNHLAECKLHKPRYFL